MQKSDQQFNVKIVVRRFIAKIAYFLNKRFGNRITPNGVTYTGLLMHIPIAYFIGVGSYYLAAILLIIFGLFDTLDGELARLQKKDSVSGMLLDASTDRFKEVLIYAGIAYSIVVQYSSPIYIVYVVLALGASLSVSYVKAKGEAVVAVSDNKIKHQDLNKMFSAGLLSYEVRMSLIVIGLLFNIMVPVVILIAVFSSYTVLRRLNQIMQTLR